MKTIPFLIDKLKQLKKKKKPLDHFPSLPLLIYICNQIMISWYWQEETPDVARFSFLSKSSIRNRAELRADQAGWCSVSDAESHGSVMRWRNLNLPRCFLWRKKYCVWMKHLGQVCDPETHYPGLVSKKRGPDSCKYRSASVP